jgi:hypothetical protein
MAAAASMATATTNWPKEATASMTDHLVTALAAHCGTTVSVDFVSAAAGRHRPRL